MPPAKKRAPRCAYVEVGQRCRRGGTGNPPLCDAHRIVLEAEAARPARPGEKIVGLLGRMFRGQKISDEHLHAGFEDLADMFSRAPGEPPRSPLDAARMHAQDYLRRAQSQPQARRPPPRQAPRQPPPKPKGPDPRVVLGFAPGQRVTAAQVKARHRELARLHHPDRGGSVTRMQDVNSAVDQLLATL